MALLTPEVFGALSVTVGLSASTVYIVSILRGKTKPHLYTWLVWSILPTIGFFAQLHGAAGPGAWASGITALASILIACLAFKYGEMNKTRSDLIALILSLGAILPWVLTKDPLGSVILISIIDIVAFYPTFRKSWAKPEEENLPTYAISALTMTLSLFAMATHSMTTLLYPAVFVLGNVGFIAFNLWRRWLKKV